MPGLPAQDFGRRERRCHPIMLRLAHGLEFADLYTVDGAARIDACLLRPLAGAARIAASFFAHLARADAALAERLLRARAAPALLAGKDESALLIDVAP